MLEIRNLSKSFGDNNVLKQIDFSVNKGEVVAIIGPSGSGKTTLLRCISFLETADSGKMIFGEDDAPVDIELGKVDKKTIAKLRRNMGFVFQSFNLFNNMTVIKNVMEGLVTARKVKKDEAQNIAMEMLEKVGMADRADYYPDQLSGGQQQRVAIARALATKPMMILFDEPTSALDPELTGEVLAVMKKLADEGTTMVVVTHEMTFAKNVADRIVFMENGVIVEDSDSKTFFDNPKEERSAEFVRKVMHEIDS